jgi:hypothetical protein
MTPADTEMNGADGEGELNANGQQSGQPQAAGQPQPMISEGTGDESEGPATP